MSRDGAPAEPVRFLASRTSFLLAVLTTSLALFFVGLFALTRSADRELAHWTSPAGEHLVLFEADRDFSSFPLAAPRRHYLHLGRERDPSSYGHRLPFELHAAMVDPATPLATYAKRVSVTWSDAGVTVEEPSGHRLFVPRRAYSGGR